MVPGLNRLGYVLQGLANAPPIAGPIIDLELRDDLATASLGNNPMDRTFAAYPKHHTVGIIV